MLDQSIASGPDSPRVPEPQVLVGHVVCSRELHADLKELVRTWLDWRVNCPEDLPRWLDALTVDDQRRLGVFIATRQPWPGTTLLWWNCPDCNSTLAVCGDCRDEGKVETKGREVACDCQYGERGAA